MPHFSGNFSNSKMIYRDHRRRFGTSTSGSTSTAMDSNYNANGDGSSSIEDNNNNNDGMEEAVPKLNPTVAMLLRGEHLPTVKAAVPTTEKKMSTRKGKKVEGPGEYIEQIQICVANPGRFAASWCLLTILFGEPELYDYVRKCAWTPKDLAPFVIDMDENENGGDEDEENEEKSESFARIMGEFNDAKMHFSLNEQQQKQMTQLEVKNLELTEENREIWQKLRISNSKLEKTIQMNEQKMTGKFSRKMELQNSEHQKEKLDLKERIALLEKMLKDSKMNAESADNKLEEIIQANQQQQVEEEESAHKMANLKDTLPKEAVNSDHVHPLIMVKKLINPPGNVWNGTKTKAKISVDGLEARNNTIPAEWLNVCASQGFGISAAEHSGMDSFQGTILYYFEISQMSGSGRAIYIGLLDGKIPPADGEMVGLNQQFYGFPSGYYHCSLAGKTHPFEWPNGATKPKWDGQEDVIGCGLLLSPKKEMAIFFTANRILMGKQIPINPFSYCLYPIVSIYGNVSVEANFGDNPAKPFKFDTDKCPGLVFE